MELRAYTLWHRRFQPVSVQFRIMLKSLTLVLPMQRQCFRTNQELFTVVPWERSTGTFWLPVMQKDCLGRKEHAWTTGL